MSGDPSASASALDRETLGILEQALARLDAGFAHLPPAGNAPLAADRIAPVLLEVAERLRDNPHLFHPLYAGQMLKPPHPAAPAIRRWHR
jgi:tyrosine decarboxylase/aspartate 1-decarboxylase